MIPINNSQSFLPFPDHIVPAATVEVSQLGVEAKDLENQLSIKYAAMADQKAKEIAEGRIGQQGKTDYPSRTYNNLRDKIEDLEGKVRDLYDNNPQWTWAREYADALICYGNSTYTGQDEKMISYLDARVDERDFAHVTEFYNGKQGQTMPAILRQVNQVPAVANRIVGEADVIGFTPTVSVSDKDSILEKLDDWAGKRADDFTKEVRQRAGVDKILGAPVEDGDAGPVSEPQDLAKMNFVNHHLDDEAMLTKALHYLMRNPDLSYKHKLSHEGLRWYIATGKMCFEVWDDIEDPNITAVHPCDLFCMLSRTNPFIQQGDGAGRYFAAQPQEIINMCPEMRTSDVERLREAATQYADRAGTMSQDWWDGHKGFFTTRRGETVDPLYLHCWRFNFMASKRVRVEIIENEFDLENPHMRYVSDDVNRLGATYAYRFVDEVWEGYRFANDIYYQLRPVPGQHKHGDYVSKKTLNFVGIVDPNPSLGQLMQPIEALRMEVFFTIERLMAQAMPKIMVVDKANESDNADNVYKSRAFGIWEIDSTKEGDQGLLNPGGAKKLNMPEVVDMGLSSALNYLYTFITFLDNNIAQLTGINGPRKGEVKADTGLGQQDKAQEASSMATQPYFTTFYTVAEMTFNKVLEQIQRTWGGKDIVRLFKGKSGPDFLHLTGDKWPLPKYRASLTNAVTDHQIQAQIYKLAEALMPIQNEPQMALGLIKMLNSDSAKESEEIFTKAIDIMEKINKGKSESEEKQAQAEMMLKKAEQDNALLREKIKSIIGPTEVEKLRGQFSLEKVDKQNEFKKHTMEVKKTDAIDTKIAEHEMELDKLKKEKELQLEPTEK